jgi:hypothetical protein
VSTAILLWVMLQAGGSPGMERSPIDARPMLKVPDFAEESPAD